jgi:hypothetical protein
MSRSFLSTGMDEAAHFEKSPVAEGFVAGLKAALLGAPVGAAVQALRGKDALTGALLGAVIPGLLAGLAKGGTRKLENLSTEADLRYHAQNIKDREPMFFMPPRQQLGRYFSRRYDGS